MIIIIIYTIVFELLIDQKKENYKVELLKGRTQIYIKAFEFSEIEHFKIEVSTRYKKNYKFELWSDNLFVLFCILNFCETTYKLNLNNKVHVFLNNKNSNDCITHIRFFS